MINALDSAFYCDKIYSKDHTINVLLSCRETNGVYTYIHIKTNILTHNYIYEVKNIISVTNTSIAVMKFRRTLANLTLLGSIVAAGHVSPQCMSVGER